ncbi:MULTISPECIES: McbB family protein [unclassified Exiguobacterium]|uniref:McbB family protein n=1 Tax=unclassified Exiguobacterium TaxID=2644629 RepID=UPI001BEC450C|nr:MULTISPECIES: McbB family protein [unclassified Exiguobacterium]
MIYKVSKFLYYSISKDLMVCQNEHGVVKIHHQSLIEFLKNINNEVRQNNKITYDEIRNVFPEDTDGVINFLLDHQLITEYHEMNLNIQQVLLISNSIEVEKVIIDNINDDIKIDSVSLNEAEGINEFEENTLVVLFMNPYIKSKAKLIRDISIKSKNCYVITSYMYNEKFHFDSVFNSEWKNPCHLCNLGILEETLTHNRVSNDYKEFIDNLMTEHSQFVPESILGKRKSINIATFIINKIESITGIDEYTQFNMNDFKVNYQINLNDHTFFSDTSIHWELCDCYE